MLDRPLEDRPRMSLRGDPAPVPGPDGNPILNRTVPPRQRRGPGRNARQSLPRFRVAARVPWHVVRSKLAVALVLLGVSLVVLPGASASPRPLPLSARLIERGEFAGFRPEPGLARYSTAQLWVQADPQLTAARRIAQLARLRREGYKGLVQEFLDRRGVKGAGVSWVMRLGSPASARTELTASLNGYKTEDAAKGASFSPFAVKGVPGARGFELSGAGQIGENVFFADGPFLYLVGQGFAMTDTNPPTRAGLITAVKKLYQRVHGRPAG